MITTPDTELFANRLIARVTAELEAKHRAELARMQSTLVTRTDRAVAGCLGFLFGALVTTFVVSLLRLFQEAP